MKAPPLDAKARPIALAVVAVLLIAGFAITSLSGPHGDGSVGPAKRTGGDVAHETSSFASHDRAVLEARYKAILDADPFREHRFEKRNKSGGDGPRPETVASTGSGGLPGTLALRLTYIDLSESDARHFFQDISAGKGVFVKKGESLGERSIAEVGSDSRSLILATAKTGEKMTLAVGDKVDVAANDIASRLFTIASVGTSTTSDVASKGGSSGPLPTLTEEKKNDILEKMRAKRKASLADKDKPAEAPPADKPK